MFAEEGRKDECCLLRFVQKFLPPSYFPRRYQFCLILACSFCPQIIQANRIPWKTPYLPNLMTIGCVSLLVIKPRILDFNILLSVHLSISLVNDQLDAQFLYFIIRLLQSSTCFEQRRAHHQEVKFYCSSFSTCIPDGQLQRVTVPDAVLVQFALLMMSTTLLETCRGL